MSKHIKSIIPFRADIEELKEETKGVPDNRSKALIDIITKTGPIMDDDLDELREYIGNNVISDPSPLNPSSMGFVALDNPLSVCTDGRTISIGIERRERLLPKDVIDRMVNDRVKKREALTETTLHRLEVLGIKDEVKAELMPKAMIRARISYVTFERKGNDVWMMVMNCSDKAADQVLNYVKETILPSHKAFSAGWSMIDRTINYYLKTVLSLHLMAADTDTEKKVSSEVGPHVDIKLKHPDHGSVTLKTYRDEGFDTAVNEYVNEDYFVTTLGVSSTLTGADSLFFKISDKFRFFGFDVSGDRLEDEYGDIESMVAAFFAECFVFSREVQAQVGLIREVCGDAQ